MKLPKTIQKLLQNATLRGGSLSIFDQAVSSDTNFLTTVLIGRICGRDELGIYFVIFNLVLFARNVQQQLITGPYTVLIHQQEEKRVSVYTGSTLVHQSVFALVMAIVTFTAGHFLTPESRFSSPWMIGAIFVLFLPLILFRDLVRQFELARLNFFAVLAIDSVIGVIQVGGLFVGGRMGYISAGLANAFAGIGSLIAAIGWYFFCRPQWRTSLVDSLNDWFKNWSLGKWSVASHFIGSSTPYFLPWIAVVAKGNDETGVLAACTTLIGLSNVFVLGIDNYLMVRASAIFAQGGMPALHRILWNFAMVYLIGMGLFCAGVTLFGGFVMEFVYGSGYRNTESIMIALSLSVLCRSIGMIASTGIVVLQHPKVNLISDLILLVVTIVVTALTIESQGIFGIAIATLAGALVASISRLLTFVILSNRLQKHNLETTEALSAKMRTLS